MEITELCAFRGQKRGARAGVKQKNEDQFLVNKWNEIGEMTFPEDHTGEKAKKYRKNKRR